MYAGEAQFLEVIQPKKPICGPRISPSQTGAVISSQMLLHTLCLWPVPQCSNRRYYTLAPCYVSFNYRPPRSYSQAHLGKKKERKKLSQAQDQYFCAFTVENTRNRLRGGGGLRKTTCAFVARRTAHGIVRIPDCVTSHCFLRTCLRVSNYV